MELVLGSEIKPVVSMERKRDRILTQSQHSQRNCTNAAVSWYGWQNSSVWTKQIKEAGNRFVYPRELRGTRAHSLKKYHQVTSNSSWTSYGVACELHSFAGKGHGFFNGKLFRPKIKDLKPYEKTLQESVKFCRWTSYRQLKSKKNPIAKQAQSKTSFALIQLVANLKST